MRKLYIFGLVTLAAAIIGLAWAEQMTFSTYYPAPHGVYREMNVHYLDFKNDLYQEGVGSMPEHEEARICYDSNDNVFKYSYEGAWQPFGGGRWALDSDNDYLYTSDSTEPETTWRVGIGTTNPEFRLTLDKDAASPDGGILAIGTRNSGANLSTSGAGTRLMWYPRKAAFRVGEVNSSQWDNANIGSYSIAMGWNTMASGTASTAMGWGTTANGSSSTAMGSSTTASGISSTAMGSNTTASGTISTAMGWRTKANGFYSTAMGQDTTASGAWSTAMGNNTTAGESCSTAMGSGTTASGRRSVAMGWYTTAQSAESVVLGRYNVISGSPTSWNDGDPVFVIGNGSSEAAPSNAVTVLKNGRVGIGTASPAAGFKLDVEGEIQATAFDVGDITFRDQKTQQILWRMFEDEEGLYLESLKTGKVYSFVLQEVEK